MKHTCKRFLSWMLVVCMVLSFIPAASASGVVWKETDLKITAPMSDRLVQKDKTEREDSEMVRVSIVLDKPSAVQAGYATMGISANTEAIDYQARLLSAQKKMEKTISTRALNGRPLDVVWNMTLVGNIISAWVPYGSLEKIAAIDGVKTVAMEAQYEPAVAERHEGVSPNTYPSGGMIGSGILWNGGYTGAGTRIAIIDTGTDTDHQSFDNGAYLYALAENAAAKGMSLEAYKASLNLMTEETIKEVLPQLHAYARYPGLTAADLYRNEKLAFGFNYVDSTLNIVHDYDQQGEHGSHVAGISTANRYIPQGSGYVDARDSVMMLGVAPDAQLITMKVFGDGSPYDSDYMAAIEDAIWLGCDAVNLSLGTTVPGSPYTDVYSELMEMMTHTDTVVVVSAGNASNWAAASLFGYLYNDDVSFDTVGAPGSYASAFTVASVDNDGTVGNYFAVGGKKNFYGEVLGYGNTVLANLDTSLELSGTEYEYIFLDGLGYAAEYSGIEVSGKIVFVSRGTLNFSEKANNALSRGAAAVVVYNNEPGMQGMDLTGLSYAAPVVAITQSDAAAIRAMSEDKGTHLTGKLTIYGRMGVGMSGSEYYTMSDFSSWGVPSSLTLKPEITAPGGEIYSLWGSNALTVGGSDKYEMMSGTSMAAPQVTGMAALLAQVYRENGMAAKSGLSARHLAQSLLMSTAEPIFEEASGGNYYSLLNQGAGLARVDLASQADSFIKVEGQADYKVKAELGDDPQRTGIYEFEFIINNLTDSEKVYALDADLFRQDVFEYQPDSNVWLLNTWTTGLDADVIFYSEAMSGSSAESHDLNGDGKTSAADADFLLEYLVGNETALKADGDLSGDGNVDSYDAHLLLASMTGEIVTVPANGTATVEVRMALTDEAKAELDAQTPKGTYVEAFVYARGVADAEGTVGTVHSIPVLAFYGDWSEPTMYDRGTLIELVSMTTDTAPYLYRFNGPYGNALGIDYGDGIEYYYGGNPVLDDETYLPERNAFNSVDASKLTEQCFTLIRGAGAARIQVTNADTGVVYFERQLGELYPAYYDSSYGQWENTIQYARLDWTGSDAAGNPLAEGTKVNVSLTAIPHYYRQEDGSFSFDGLGTGTTMTTTITIDNTAPKALNIDVSRIDENKLTVKAKDNEYVAAVALLNANDSKILDVLSPNQTEKNKEVTVELDLTGIYGTRFLVAVYDYAGNMTTYEAALNLGALDRGNFTAVDNKESWNNATLQTMAQPIPVEQESELKGIQVSRPEGILNNTAAPLSSGGMKNDAVRVTVTVPTEAFEPTNGTLWVEFDPSALKLKDVQGRTDAFAWKQVETGKVAIAYAEVTALANDSVIANLDFTALAGGKTVVNVIWGEYGQKYLELAERIVVDLLANNPFTDVPEGSFYHDPVLWAVENGITNGTTSTTFDPNGQCMRAVVVTFLWRAAGEPEPTSTKNPFTDVKESDFFYKAVLWAVENGITNGISATKFAPYALCNRAQVVTFLWRSQSKPTPTATKSGFTDVTDTQAFYYDAVLWAIENNITNGMGDGTFGVNGICNRAQVVTFLYRTLA